ncbi:PAS domain-containing protein [Teredinibacter haidensis]|uniref:PAS domain-containing protein n=1 Tax=Teredinibacter haidensis TaxID=2731755 RepID=UPI0009490DE8|nr:PAS domain-containing protein [Teredinibacter haidensis]
MNWFKRAGISKADISDSAAYEFRQKISSLEKNVASYERIFRGSSHGYAFLDWDVNRFCLDWVGSFWSHLGYAEADMVHISSAETFMEYVHPDDKSKLNSAVHALLRGLGLGEAIFRIRKKRGGHIWAEVRVEVVRDQKGRVRYVSGVVYDITKLKQTEQALLISEARHARILQSSNDGIWEWSAEHGGFHFSSRCWEHLGYSEHDDLVNQGIDRMQAWRKRIHEENLSIFDNALKEHVREKTPFDIEYRILGKDNEWRWIRARGQMAYSDEGKATRMSGTNMDITQVKRAEERVLKAKEDAELANRAKSDFLSSMSHELRTPLNAILGFAQLFDLDKTLSLEQQTNVAEIQQAGEHLLQLVGDVLDLAKIESGRMGFSLEPVAPVRLLKEVVMLIQAQADIKNISVQLEANGLEEKTIIADAVRLKQILLNLVSNSVKYNRDFGKVIIGCQLGDGDVLRVSVRDTGRGIPDKLQKQLFQPFNRLGAEATNIVGSGVGLVITKQLVEQMKGAIGFVSKEGVGSTFWVEFPIYHGQPIEQLADQYDRTPSELSSEIPDMLVTENKRILYVEDNPPNQRLMKQLLVRYPNLELDLTGEPLRGIFMARTTKPDLIIMDINLPGMDGFEALEVLKQDESTKDIPVIALTANAMVHDIEKGRASAFDFYLTKPLDLKQLIDVFNELLL